MEQRRENLLTLVIENYIKEAEPVGSRFLVENDDLDWSEATVRNELRLLEEEGFLTHPHTSAGRIPTAKGYRHYINSLDPEKINLSKQETNTLEESVLGIKDLETARKNMAKALADLSQETLLVAFSPEKVYYTGLSNLFQKPDFGELSLVADLSQIFDRCEESLPDFFEMVDDEPRYFLGREHPFGKMLSIMSVRFGKKNESLIALLGPQRMNYKKNWGLMKKAKEII